MSQKSEVGRPLSRRQIDAIITRVRQQCCDTSNLTARENARAKANKQARMKAYENMFKPTVPSKIKTKLAELLEQEFYDGVPGVPKDTSMEIDPITAQINSTIADLKFKLTMTGVTGYEKIVKEFETKLTKIVK